METKTRRNTYLIYSVIIVLLLGMIIYGYNIKTKNDIITKTFEIDSKMTDIWEKYGAPAEEYYELASEDYILKDYKGVVRNCEKARGYYSQEGQKYRNLKAELELEKQHKLIVLYQDLLVEQVKISENMYEACEYFESSCKYYDIYFKTDVDSDDSSFDMGNAELESMNNKINLHDDAVRRYNDILSKITVERLRL